MKQFASGAKSSEEAPRYDLLEPAALRRMADRMARGAASHGVRNYQSGKGDPAFLQDRINHLVGHALKFASGDQSDDHLDAVLANANILSYLLEPDRGTYDDKRAAEWARDLAVPVACHPPRSNIRKKPHNLTTGNKMARSTRHGRKR